MNYKNIFEFEIKQTINDLENDNELNANDIKFKLHKRLIFKKFNFYVVKFVDKKSGEVLEHLKLAVVKDWNDFLNKKRGFNLNRSSNNGICFHNGVDYFVYPPKIGE